MINTPKHLAYVLKCGTSEEELFQMCYELSQWDETIDKKYYRKKEETKIDKLGRLKVRILYPSKGRLKLIQQRIKGSILQIIPLPSFVQGGVKKRDNLTNASAHKG